MKILAMIILVLLILAVGFVGYVYKKNAMFLPALFGIGGFPNIKKKDYYQADGTFRKAEKDDKMAFFMPVSYTHLCSLALCIFIIIENICGCININLKFGR